MAVLFFSLEQNAEVVALAACPQDPLGRQLCGGGISYRLLLLPEAVDHLGAFLVFSDDLFETDVPHDSYQQLVVEIPRVFDARAWQYEKNVSVILELAVYKTQHLPCDDIGS
jgi:hypothetical protein